MGSFFGHVLPGTFFIVAGLWWVVRIYKRHFESLRKGKPHYISSVTFPIQCCTTRCCSKSSVDIEAIVAVVMCGIGMLVELIIAPIFRHTGHMGMNNAQHGTMYFFFGLVGIIALVSRRVSILPQSDDILYITLTLAYVTEAVLFQFHLFGRQSVDVLLHTLLLYTVYGAILSTIMEMVYKHNMLLAQCRAFFTILQGTWFWQAGFYLYNPFRGAAWAGPYDGHDADKMTRHEEHKMHENMMFMTCSFAWHMAAIFIMILIIGAVIGCTMRRKEGFDEMRLLPRKYPPMAGYSRVEDEDDDDEDEQIWGRDVANREVKPEASNHVQSVEPHSGS